MFKSPLCSCYTTLIITITPRQSPHKSPIVLEDATEAGIAPEDETKSNRFQKTAKNKQAVKPDQKMENKKVIKKLKGFRSYAVTPAVSCFSHLS